MTDPVETGLGRLREQVRAMSGGVVVAFSGGIDSVLLLRVCKDELGDRVLAATADSASYPAHDRDDAAQMAALFGVEHRFIATGEVTDERYRRNDADRCYFCKHTLFDELTRLAGEVGAAHVAFGANKDDEGDFRPGHRAAREFGVRAPLLDAGLTKDDVRRIARHLDIPIWRKPASACLASRVPYGTTIDEEMLARIDAAETALRSRGYPQCRVRHHGRLARVELPPEDIARAAASPDREWIAARLKEIGYLYVSIDLAGYVSGSLNAALPVSAAGAGSSPSSEPGGSRPPAPPRPPTG